jgi:gamma-glutamyltranspeptidase/glutathione hydrolase
MVVSVNALATRAGVERLAAGGNAIDAAITTAFALAVTHPSAGNIGGGGFALIRLPSGETYALDFREASPEGLNLERFFAMTRGKGDGPDSIGVPGTVAGLYALSERFGKTPMKALIEPARVLAEQGHIIEKREAEGIAVSWSKLKLSPLGRRRWGSREGTPLSIGQRIRLPELAATLKRLQTDGRRGFYEGVTSESIVKESGIPPQIHATDLALYQAKWRKPVSFDYRGLRVTTMPPPSAGGIALMSGLLQLGQYDFSSIPMSSIQRAHLLLEVIRRAQADRLYSVSDPDALTAEERGRRVERWLNPLRWTTIAPISLETATDNERVKIGISEMRESDQTTHLSVVDAEGMAVNLTTTLSSGFGSKVVTETGIVLNNSLGSFSGKGENQPAPARRTTSSMAPTFVDDAEGLRLVLGTPGGDSIPSTLLQLIQLLVDYQIPVDEAVDAPRIHQSVVGRAHARSERKRPIPRELRRKLEAMGHHFTTETAYMGHANTIVILGGIAYGYVDPREGGLALGLPSPSP